jgi:hypothetical protein
MNLIERLPSLDDSELKNLCDNARRLLETGSDKQQLAAAELLPAVESALAARRALRVEATAARAAERRALAARSREKAAPASPP